MRAPLWTSAERPITFSMLASLPPLVQYSALPPEESAARGPIGPPTLLQFDRVVISRTVTEGKSKYVLNGRAETQDKIKNMFMGMQLNVNNLHFLVMQGRIA